jgi:TolA-binding protein
MKRRTLAKAPGLVEKLGQTRQHRSGHILRGAVPADLRRVRPIRIGAQFPGRAGKTRTFAGRSSQTSTKTPMHRFFALLLGATLLLHPIPRAVAQQPKDPGKVSDRKLEQIHRNNKRKAEEKMARDSRLYSPKEMADLEQTYQIANRNTRSPEAIDALKKVVEKYEKSNRAGCAALYLGRWTQGDEQQKYLKLAIENYSDAYYLDGTSVGGYARLILGHVLQQAGNEAEARKLFDEVRKNYDDAQDHSGALLIANLPK